MRRFFVLVTFVAAFAASGAVACGDANKPPLTPDIEHPTDVTEAGAPSNTTPAPSNTTPAK